MAHRTICMWKNAAWKWRFRHGSWQNNPYLTVYTTTFIVQIVYIREINIRRENMLVIRGFKWYNEYLQLYLLVENTLGDKLVSVWSVYKYRNKMKSHVISGFILRIHDKTRFVYQWCCCQVIYLAFSCVVVLRKYVFQAKHLIRETDTQFLRTVFGYPWKHLNGIRICRRWKNLTGPRMQIDFGRYGTTRHHHLHWQVYKP